MKATTHKIENLKMDDGVYKLRREVIGYIYELKNSIPTLPRITVRVTEDHKEILAVARMEENIIWVSKRAINEFDLRTIVYHEIGHAVYGAEHDDNCPIMKPAHSKNERISKVAALNAMKKIANG